MTHSAFLLTKSMVSRASASLRRLRRPSASATSGSLRPLARPQLPRGERPRARVDAPRPPHAERAPFTLMLASTDSPHCGTGLYANNAQYPERFPFSRQDPDAVLRARTLPPLRVSALADSAVPCTEPQIMRSSEYRHADAPFPSRLHRIIWCSVHSRGTCAPKSRPLRASRECGTAARLRHRVFSPPTLWRSAPDGHGVPCQSEPSAWMAFALSPMTFRQERHAQPTCDTGKR